MKILARSVTRLEDYAPPAFCIVASELIIDLDFHKTQVNARHQVRRRVSDHDAQLDTTQDMRLDMEAMEIHKISIDGVALNQPQYRIEDHALILFAVPDEFDLTIENTIRPAQNTALSGLYKSANLLCTQCEAEGFRRITPAIDRPDNLGEYTVTLRAQQKTFPLLLCNGNLVDEGACGASDNGMHYTTWHDPYPKPTYLFAIVAGKLSCLEDSFTTCSGRKVALKFFAACRDINKCVYAMASLKRAMAWDEKIYGREYDLDLFNVVAVEDFNMGAMENKSLNIFNTQCVLADPAMATDDDFETVEAVIGHEYFHNWSGNRVTCRDWFQLSLKEGFTVFREQQFSADMGSAAVKRIADVAGLRSYQFREDAGPMAHAVRPDSYREINNFYTATVYNKGAEVIRMLHELLGAEQFRRATDLYFARHDGQAVTTDDFVAAMESIGGMDLTQFKNWYSQAGTPVVEVETVHHADRGVLEITLSQHCKPTPQQPQKAPFVIPIKFAFFDSDGKRIPLIASDNAHDYCQQDDLLVLSEARQTFTFPYRSPRQENDHAQPVVSLLRGFSAPIELRQPLSKDQLTLLLAHEDDPFNRWEAGQKLFLGHILKDSLGRIQTDPQTHDTTHGTTHAATHDTTHVTVAFLSVLTHAEAEADPALQAEILTLPDQSYISEQVTYSGAPIHPAAVFHARHALKHHLASVHKDKLLEHYHRLNARNDGTITAEQIGMRSLRDTCLGYLMALDSPEIHQLATALLTNSHCMTDSVSALTALANSHKPDRQALLDDFYQHWKKEPLVVDKWLRIQARVATPDTLARVEALTRHPAFDSTNPNKVYALLAGFSHGNPFCFHAADGSGYRFVRKWVACLDSRNPQVSARLVSAFTNWKKYSPELKTQMRAMLKEIAELPGLSPDVAEIVSKSLEN